MDTSANKPNIRFEGFSGDWEQRKLHEMVEYTSSSHKASDAAESGKYDLYDANSVIGKTNSSPMRTEYITIIKDGAGVGRIRVLPANTLFIGTMGAMTAKNSDLPFVFALLTLADLGKECTGSTIPHIYFRDYGINAYSVPSLDEQKKIGQYFRNLDNLISLQQRKLETLKETKKAMLQKMFPQEGQTVPEIRFEGFCGEWEKSLVKGLCTIATGKSNTQDQSDDGSYPFYIRSEVPVRSNKYLYDCEAVITIGDGNIGRVFHYVNGKFDLHQRCYKMTDFRGIEGKYFYYFFSAKFYNRAMKMTAKATVDSVRLDMISDMEIYFPKSLEEQYLIAEYLTQLDNLIALQQRKLEALQQIKKGMLQQMFC